MAATLKPLSNRVIVVQTHNKVSAGGIQLPDNIRHEQGRGVVVAVGPGMRDILTGTLHPMDVKKGDSLWFCKWQEQMIDGQKYLLVEEQDILAIVVPDEG